VTIRGIDHDIVLSGDRAVVGRLKACDICLADANASREHAAFEREGTGWAIHDLGSTNGTMLNGEPVSRQRLREGDVVVIGVTELVYHEPRG
jgi:pSer/pThr/pTyr-binding forkhead associated (FHA) protein